MCGIFGGIGISKKDAQSCIDLIKRGNDGINVEELANSVIFAGGKPYLVDIRR